MNRLEATLRGVAQDLTRCHCGWAIVGGFAVSARTVPRFTRDVAVAVADDAAAEGLTRSFLDLGYRSLASVEHDNGRLATVRLQRPSIGGDVTVDLLFASSGIEPEVAKGADEIEVVSELVLPVATTGHLIALKLLAQ